ncbi:adenylosuccinate synthetase [Rhizobium leguminosarum]|uniref:adenylosuccinate synthetase n=1 Tax=Rhizobium leguminosarum TaxID=384 RepID=UPI003F96317B
MKRIIAVSGPIGVGKSSFFQALERRIGGRRISTRKIILTRTGVPNERKALQDAGEKLDLETDGQWVATAAESEAASTEPNQFIFIDAVRIESQIRHLRTVFGDKVLHLHLTASDEILQDRYSKRPSELKEFETYEEVRASVTERAIEQLGTTADMVLDAGRIDANTLAGKVAYNLGGYDSNVTPLVDVIVGAQFGSEGKGNICAHLAKNYEVLMRVGGPNAGHMVAAPRYKYVQLPSGTGSNKEALILIGAGTTIWLPRLLIEMLDHSLSASRLAIDPQAIVITQADRDYEDALEAIGSTKQGVGAASARKILGRDGKSHIGSRVQLAKDVDELKSYVRDTKFELQKSFSSGKRVMLEGTQGTDLSIHHGPYPHVTSRETTASGCLADAGIGPRRVRKVVIVTRTFPIRVGGDSGDLPMETSFDAISKSSGVPVDEIAGTEVGTVSRKKRRIGEFSFEQVQRSAELNGATDIALTFADYLGVQNQKATRYEELTEKTRQFIDEVENRVGVRVSLISKAFNVDAVIQRGEWK